MKSVAILLEYTQFQRQICEDSSNDPEGCRGYESYIFSSVLIMVPAPRNPTPTITEAAILQESAPGKASMDRIVRKDDPSPTSLWVLTPAGFRLTSLSSPTIT